MAKFSQNGFDRGRLIGLDLNAARIHAARSMAPDAALLQADCRAIPARDSVFDLALQFTVFTSLKRAERLEAAREVLRILKPGGLLIWYDFFAPNPLNAATRPIRRAEIHSLFPHCRISLERATLVAPLARMVALLCPSKMTKLERIPWLRTHYVGVIQKPAAED